MLKLSQGITLYSVPPPGSGTILALILNILDGYNFNETSISSIERAILTDHRIVEAFKFAFAKRTELGDPEFLPTNLVSFSDICRTCLTSIWSVSRVTRGFIMSRRDRLLPLSDYKKFD